MAEKYVLRFNKTGYMIYISHLDLLRLFKRVFRACGIEIRYSMGFNPHPKLSFAQPLSLGYTGINEFLEFETSSYYEPEIIIESMREKMPEGVEITGCFSFNGGKSALAALAESALYEIELPLDTTDEDLSDCIESYLKKQEIRVLKRRKKDKKYVETNIRPMIRKMDGQNKDGKAVIRVLLDCGSASNCSPELIISSFAEHMGKDIPRQMINVTRLAVNFSNNLQFKS